MIKYYQNELHHIIIKQNYTVFIKSFAQTHYAKSPKRILQLSQTRPNTNLPTTCV